MRTTWGKRQRWRAAEAAIGVTIATPVEPLCACVKLRPQWRPIGMRGGQRGEVCALTEAIVSMSIPASRFRGRQRKGLVVGEPGSCNYLRDEAGRPLLESYRRWRVVVWSGLLTIKLPVCQRDGSVALMTWVWCIGGRLGVGPPLRTIVDTIHECVISHRLTSLSPHLEESLFVHDHSALVDTSEW